MGKNGFTRAGNLHGNHPGVHCKEPPTICHANAIVRDLAAKAERTKQVAILMAMMKETRAKRQLERQHEADKNSPDP